MKAKRIISTTLLLALFLPLFIAYPVHRAEAQLFVPSYDAAVELVLLDIAANTTVSAGANTTQAFFDETLWTKEYILDLIVYSAGTAAVQTISASLQNMIINAANSFVRDLKQELMNLENDVADKLGAEITEASGGYLSFGSNIIASCFPDLEMAPVPMPAWTVPKFQLNISCAQSSPEEMGNFYKPGGFTWEGWRKKTFNAEQNSPYGRYIKVQNELERRTVEAKANEVKQLDWGRGFRGVVDKLTGVISKPAAAIQSQLDEAYGADLDRMKNADELSEIVSSIVSSMVQAAILGAGQEFGFSQPPEQ